MKDSRADAIGEITSEVEKRLGEWFGGEATLLSNLPELRKLRRSFFVRYEVSRNGNGASALLIKIPRPRTAENLGDALQLQQPRTSTRKEFEMLVACSQIFREASSQNLCAVRPLAYFPDWNAIAMEELNSVPLNSIRLHTPLFRNLRGNRYAFHDLLERAGRWLRLFHSQLGEPKEETFGREELLSISNSHLEAIETNSPDLHSEINALRKLLERKISAVENRPLPFVCLHGDFKCRNILVTRDGSIAAVDSKLRRRGPIYADIAKLLADVLTYPPVNFTFGLLSRPELWKESILNGYFRNRSEKIDHQALELFSAVSLFEKWKEDEAAFKRIPRLSALLRFSVRKYFTRCITRHLTALGFLYQTMSAYAEMIINAA